jgi:hypothetical protein
VEVEHSALAAGSILQFVNHQLGGSYVQDERSKKVTLPGAFAVLMHKPNEFEPEEHQILHIVQ